jgi:hypothetical protein
MIQTLSLTYILANESIYQSRVHSVKPRGKSSPSTSASERRQVNLAG